MSLLEMSISAGVMIAAIIVIRALTINRLPKRTFLVLWGLALLRLLIPFSLPSPLSVYSLAGRAVTAGGAEYYSTPANTAPFGAPFAAPQITGNIQAAASPEVPLLPLIWLAGAVLCALYFAFAYFKYRREFIGSLPVESTFASEWLASHRLKRSIDLRQTSRVAAPLTYGVLRPVILMPKRTDWADTAKLQYVLQHEYVHIRRFDSVAKMLLIAALCVHWFNPFAWAMYILANRDLELSCDEAVIRAFGGAVKTDYALALISMEEQKSGFAPFCNSFSKNAIEGRIRAIMKMKKATAFTLLAALIVIAGTTAVFATSSAPAAAPAQASTDKTFGEYERQKLVTFKFDGYEDMTVAEYQKKAWELMDTSDYRAVIERIGQNNMLYKMRYNNNEYAAFLFYILEPLTAEKWQTRDFDNYVQAPKGTTGDAATLEYTVTLTISDAKSLTVGQYYSARQGVMEGLEAFLQGKTNLELQDAEAMNTAVLAEIAALKGKWETPALRIAVEHSFVSLAADENLPVAVLESGGGEERQAPYATKEDYQSLLKLKTANYQKQTVTAFNAALLEWANEDYDRNDRVNVDAAMNDFKVQLTDSERAFVTLTVRASSEENSQLVKSIHKGAQKEDPILGNFNLSKDITDSKRVAWASLFYQLTYHIADENKMTIGERDIALAGTIGGIQRYWDGANIDTLLAKGGDSIAKDITAIAEKNSTPLIKIPFIANNIGFEGMSEPKAGYEQEILNEYEDYGLTYDKTRDRFLLDGELVRYFEDKALNRYLGAYKEGKYNVYAVRGADGAMTGIEKLDWETQRTDIMFREYSNFGIEFKNTKSGGMEWNGKAISSFSDKGTYFALSKKNPLDNLEYTAVRDQSRAGPMGCGMLIDLAVE